MKQLLLLSILISALSTSVQADTVSVIATDVKDIVGNFSQTSGGAVLASDAITTAITSDYKNAIYGLDSPQYSSIDLGFGDNTVLTGSGDDVVVYSLWSGYHYSIGLEAYDIENNLLSSFLYSTDTHSSTFETGVLTTSIDLRDTGGIFVADDIQLGLIRVFIGGPDGIDPVSGASLINAYSNVSLVGAYHTETTVVPLPLPVVLFSSGLALLGFIGRRKTISNTTLS